MVDRKLVCEVVTPEKVIYDGEVDMVVVPGTEGELGILPLHIPLITALKPGEVRLKTGEDQEYILIHEGFFQVREDKVTILVADAEIVSKIDLEKARSFKEKAERKLEEAIESGIEDDIDLARDTLSKAVLRLSAAEKAKKRQ